jgi:AraC-like DNA-binding protein
LEKKSAPSKTNPAFERCRSHLESHYPEILSISQAAGDCHVSPEHFSRLFRKFAGTTAEAFLMSLRINHAARMLLQSNMPVKEIALRVGFRDPYHFSRAFKSAHGASPKSFREGEGA